MKASNIRNMIIKFTKKYGVNIIWENIEEVENERGGKIKVKTGTLGEATVLLIKENFNVTDVDLSDLGFVNNYRNYIICLPEIKLERDMIITDHHNYKWKLGMIDYIDIGNVTVAKQIPLTEVQ